MINPFAAHLVAALMLFIALLAAQMAGVMEGDQTSRGFAPYTMCAAACLAILAFALQVAA